MKASDNEYPSVLLDEQASAPTTPASGFWRVYAKSDGLYIVDDAGTETGPFGTGGGGGSVMAAASYQRSTGNYTTASTTFVDVDGTNLALTISTGARRVLVGLAAACSASSDLFAMFDIAIDGTRQGGDKGLWACQADAGHYTNASGTFLSAPLSAGSHTFKLQWMVSANTATLHGAATGTPQLRFYVIEQPTA